jgi:hypothetical protein
MRWAARKVQFALSEKQHDFLPSFPVILRAIMMFRQCEKLSAAFFHRCRRSANMCKRFDVSCNGCDDGQDAMMEEQLSARSEGWFNGLADICFRWCWL